MEGSPPGLHIAGSVTYGNNGYAGGGLKFFSCVTLASFTRLSFDIYGSAAGCTIEVQLQTFDQRPVEQNPPGACKDDGGSSCFNFPARSNVVNASSLMASPGTTVSTWLSTFSNWSTATAGQVVAIQWQFTTSGGTCRPDATVTNVKFLP